MVKLDSNTINELVELLRPFMEDEEDRRPFLVLALGNEAPVLQRITWGGAVASFIPDIVCKLADYGEVEPGKQALWVLLEYVRSLVGGDVKQRIDKLRLLIDLRSPSSTAIDTISIDVLVQLVRDRLYDKIQRLHGTMQLLDVARPVEIDRLYVDVNILEEPCSYSRLEIDELLQGRDQREDFNRFGLSKVRERVTGLQAVKNHLKLIVLGKPGSGKTTFLQHIVIECNNGNLLPDRIPVLIKLRDLFRQAKRIGNFSLESQINFYLRGVCSQQEVAALLEAGKVLLLLDGLDEVPGAHGDAIVDEIECFIDNYDQNQLIISCRIQAQNYRFNRFAYVEVADFNYKQIAAFAQKWFTATARKGQQEGEAKAREFIEKLQENRQVRELAVTPILLILACKVFDDQSKFYSKPVELYEQGLEILLCKWDESRGIKRDQIYRELTPEKRQKLLSYIAAHKFKQSQYMLFEQREINGYIAEYLGISSEESKDVLKAIEAQHGLLLERAQRIHSFSHLTFQEYFTAKWFVERADWQDLVNYVTEKHWREVFLLVVEIVNNAEQLLLLMKQKIDLLIADVDKIQKFLKWVHKKALRIQVSPREFSYKPAAIRAFYLARSLELEIPQDCLQNTLELPFNFEFTPDRYALLPNLCEFTLSYNISDALDLAHISTFNLERGYWLARILDPDIAHHLHQLLQQLEVPNWDEYEESVEDWWSANRQSWTEKLRTVIVEYRNFGHNWQFSNEHQDLLKQYYEANKLLVDCLGSNCVVSDAVRQQIEDTLLLPITEIKKYESTQRNLKQ